MEFVAASDGSKTITAELTVDVSTVIPEIVGVRVNVLFPVPEEALNGDDRVVSPWVVTTVTEEALADGWRELPVGIPTFVVILDAELASVIFPSELTEVSARIVLLSIVTNFEGVKFAALNEIPEYLSIVEI